MKKLLTVLSILICFSPLQGIGGKNYYFTSAGDDILNTGTSPTSAFKTVTKLNSIWPSLNPGDSILFHRGETFLGQINITKPGTAALPIIISGYGTGAMPVITELTAVTSWVSLGANKYEATITGGLANLQMVTINDVPTPMGRYPNADAANGGWLTIDSHGVGNTSITDAALPGSPSYAGAKVVVRTERWIIDVCDITTHVSNTLTFPATTYNIQNGWGYFLENSISALDRHGEWCYNSATGKLTMYFVGSSPTNIKVATKQNCINSNNKSFITITGIQTTGSNDHNIVFTGGTGNTVTNCKITNNGNNGIWTSSTFFTATYNTVINSYNTGIETKSPNDVVIKYNFIYNTDMFPGMAQSGENRGMGIGTTSINKNGVFRYNTVINTGYCGISVKNAAGALHSDTLHIDYNVIDSFCLTKDDGSGVYRWAGVTDPPHYNARTIKNNIISNGIGNHYGTSSVFNSAHGIYYDVGAGDDSCLNNSIKNCGRSGIHIHAGNEGIVLDGNNLYNNGIYGGTDTKGSQLFFNQDKKRAIKNNVVSNNNIWSTGNLYSVRVDNDSSALPPIGTVNNNHYKNLSTKTTPFITQVNSSSTGRSFASWKTATGFDGSSTQSTYLVSDSIRFYTNPTNSAAAMDLMGYTWYDAADSAYTSLMLAAYSGKTLRRGTLANTHPTVTLTSPTTGGTATAPATISLAATASDGDGTIASVGFYNGTTLLGTDNSSPYTFSFTGVSAGGYSFTAHAKDNTGDSTVSNIAAYTVTSANTPPTVSLVTPAADTTVTLGDSISVKALATDGDGTISSVKFYDGGTLFHTETTSPYVFRWLFAEGDHFITAKSFDNSGDSSVSSTILVKVVKPVVPLMIYIEADTVACNGGTATVFVDATGGQPPYTGTGTFSASAGSHDYIVGDALGAADTGTIVVVEPAVLSASPPTVGTIPYLSSTPVYITATGGVTPYQYRINNGPWQAVNLFTVYAGNHVVDVMDANGCTTSTSFSVTQVTPDNNWWIKKHPRKILNQ